MLTQTQKRERLRKHLEGLMIVEVQRLFFLSLPYPKVEMIDCIVDTSANNEHIDALLASFEAEEEELVLESTLTDGHYGDKDR